MQTRGGKESVPSLALSRSQAKQVKAYKYVSGMVCNAYKPILRPKMMELWLAASSARPRKHSRPSVFAKHLFHLAMYTLLHITPNTRLNFVLHTFVRRRQWWDDLADPLHNAEKSNTTSYHTWSYDDVLIYTHDWSADKWWHKEIVKARLTQVRYYPIHLEEDMERRIRFSLGSTVSEWM